MANYVLMAVYKADSPELVEAAIQSTLQPSADVLLVGVDGPIPAELQDVLSRAGSRFANLRMVRFDTNRGLACVLNDLIALALQDPQCEFVSRMDADDLCAPDRFAQQVAFMRQNPELGVAGSAARVIDKAGTPVSEYRKPLEDAALKRRLPFDSPFIHPSVIMRASLLRQGHRYPTDTIRFEDVAFWSRLAAAGARFGNLPDRLIDYRYSLATAARRSGLRKMASETRVRVHYVLSTMPWRLDLLLVVVLVAVAKTVLPPALLGRLISLRTALT